MTTFSSFAGEVQLGVLECCPPRTQYGPQVLAQDALLTTLSGPATVWIDDERLEHRPGRTVFVRRGSKILELVADQPWNMGFLILGGPVGEAISDGLAHWVDDRLAIQEATLNAIEQCSRRPIGWTWRYLGELMTIGETRNSVGVGVQHPLIREVETLLRTLPNRHHSVRELANLVRVSARQLDYAWRTEHPEGLAKWLQTRRVNEARAMLLRGASVTESAHAAGFANPYHFSRSFRAKFGCSPSSLGVSAKGGANPEIN